MQLRCPRCRVLLEIPEPAPGTDVYHVECGGCRNRFRLQLNRPSLRFRKPAGDPSGAFEVSPPASTPASVTAPAGEESIASEPEPEAQELEDEVPQLPELETIVLTAAPGITGREIAQALGQITSLAPLSGTTGERQLELLNALTQAQIVLREKARALGADGVVGLQMDTIDSNGVPALRLRGTAVRLTPP